MIEGDVATSVDDVNPSVGVSDVTATASRDPDDRDDVTDDVDDAFLAGFRDCRREALRYLRQRDAAVSAELERHLATVERTCRRPAEADASPAGQPHDADDSALGVSLVDDEGDVDVGRLSEEADELLRLAQNNPRINNILNQLLTLMDDDVDDDDCLMTCDDDDHVKQHRDTMTSGDAVSDVS